MNVGELAPSRPSAANGKQPGDARQVAVGFEGLLFASALQPMAKSLGFFGDTVVGAVARGIAERSGDALAERLTELIEAAR